MMRLYCAFEKVEQRDDGTLQVSGVASSEAVDSDGEVILASAVEAAIPDYLRFPAVREMHRADTAAGTALDIRVDADKRTRVEALIVDPVTVKKITAGVLRGFSVGGKVLKRSDADARVIEALTLTEISVVDRPSNPEAVVTLVKLDPGASSTEEHPRSGQGVDNAHEDAKKPVDPASPTGPGATLTSNRTRKCADCGAEVRLVCGCPDGGAPEAEKAAREVARHEVAGLLHELAKVQAEAAQAIRKLAAAEAALAERTRERDGLQVKVAASPKGALMQVPVAVEKADDMAGEASVPEGEDEPLTPAAAEIRKIHRQGRRRLV